MSAGIYLIQDSRTLVELAERPYEAEELLQRLLADYPNLLAGDQVDPSAPRRWLLVTREAGVPSGEGGSGRWALDHLFLDQDGVPTLVEVKRSSDTRVRREVVGQMLDYAANAVVYWPIEAIRAQFEANCEATSRDPVDTLTAFLDANQDLEAFWQAAKRNLQAGRIRMVFVADVIPAELRRIVEFLNGQMDPAEVVALEVRQFVGEGIKALVPKVVGQTAVAQRAKSVAPTSIKRQWDEPSFFSDLERRRGKEEVAAARTIFDWTNRRGLRLRWGKGAYDGAFSPMVDHAGGTDSTIGVWSGGAVTVPFGDLSRERHAFADEQKRRQLLTKLNEIPGISIPEQSISKYPNIRLSALTDPVALRQFVGVLDWLVDEIRSATGTAEPSAATATR